MLDEIIENLIHAEKDQDTEALSELIEQLNDIDMEEIAMKLVELTKPNKEK